MHFILRLVSEINTVMVPILQNRKPGQTADLKASMLFLTALLYLLLGVSTYSVPCPTWSLQGHPKQWYPDNCLTGTVRKDTGPAGGPTQEQAKPCVKTEEIKHHAK